MDCKHEQKNIFLRTCVMMQQTYIQISRAPRKKERKRREEKRSAGLAVTTTPTTTQKSTLLVAYIHTLLVTNCTED
jgi:hypothetical protein